MNQRSALPSVALSMATHKCLSTIFRLLPPVCGIGVLLSLSPVSAADRSWTNLAGGDFDTGTNWSGNSVPGENDKAIFDVDAAYSVNFGTDVTNLALDVVDGTIGFNLQGKTYSGGNMMLIQSATKSPSLTVEGGTFEIANFTGSSGATTEGPPVFTLSGSETVGTASGLVILNTSNNVGFTQFNILNGAQFSMPNLSETTLIFNMQWRSELVVNGAGSSAEINGRFRMDQRNSVVRVEDGGYLSISDIFDIARSNLSESTILVNGADSLLESGTIRFAEANATTSQKGTIIVSDGGQVEVIGNVVTNRDTGEIALIASGTDSQLNSSGSVIVAGNWHDVTNRRGVGLLTVADGATASADRITVQAGGTLSGDGSVTTLATEGVRVLGGTVSPGVYAYSHTYGPNPAETTTFSQDPLIGTLTINGNFEQVIAIDGDDTFTPTLNIRVAGGVDGADQLNVLGDLTLAGILDIVAFDEPVLSANETFTILNWSGTLTGTFSQINAFDPGSGLSWDFDNLYVDGTISVIPEPAGVALLLGGFIALAVVLRRRR